MPGLVHVIDDDPSYRRAVERRLKWAGYDVPDEADRVHHALRADRVRRNVLTDNNNRTAPEIRVLFKKGGQLGAPGSNKFLFDHVGLVDAHHPAPNADIEAAARITVNPRPTSASANLRSRASKGTGSVLRRCTTSQLLRRRRYEVPFTGIISNLTD